MSNEKDNPGVIAPPPLIFLGGLLFGGVSSWVFPLGFLPDSVGYFVGITLVGLGIGIILVARNKMAKAETNIEPWKPTNTILSDGIYRFSRNPVYVAMVLVYLGVASLFNSVFIVLFLVPVLLLLHYGVILREEKYLERKFGKEYKEYLKVVRRWV